jgi:hypothetical protein
MRKMWRVSPIFLCGSIGMVLDAGFHVQWPLLYWLLGACGIIAASLFGANPKLN